MKRMKKLAGLLLAMVMVFSVALTAFAEEGTNNDTKGSITISNAVAGQTYTIYRVFDVESFDTSIPAYAYKINSVWKTFAENATDYVSVDGQGYVTWVEGADVVAFAKSALEYAKVNKIVNNGSLIADGTTVIFGKDVNDNNTLELGYYLVDSSLGALCSINTTKPDATIEEKNEKPTVEKKVQEDSTGNWGDANDANIGQVVNYETTIHAKKGAENYILHDKMTEGLTFDATSVVVKVGSTILSAKENSGDTSYDYELVTGLTTDCFPEEDNTTEICDFHIIFNNDYLKTITGDTDIVVAYSATLNENAVIANQTNDNDTRLVYGDENKTEWITTKTKTYEFDLVKTDKDTAKVITGATFKLYDAKTDGNEIPVVKAENGVYRVAVSGETGVVIEAGSPTIKGLDGGTTYYLEEITAPKGFNKLAARFEFTIESANRKATIVENVHQDGGVEVENQKGALLPETGGMGTTIFYILGAILVIGAAVLLITRKRMSNEQ